MLRIRPSASVGALDEEKELEESALLGRRVPGMFGLSGAAVPRIVVPLELFAAAPKVPGIGFAGVPRIVRF